MSRMILTILLIAAVALIFVCVGIQEKSRRKQRLESRFGKPPSDREKPEFPSVSAYWELRSKHNAVLHTVDDITWDDLEMNKVFARLDACQTSVGEEYLYAALREPFFEMSPLERREALISMLEADPSLRLGFQVVLSKMGKSNYNGLSSFCYDAASKKISHPFVYKALAVLPLLCGAAMFINPAAGGIGLGASFVLNGIVHYMVQKNIEREIAAIRYFSTLLWGARQISRLGLSVDNPILKDISESYQKFKRLGGKLSRIAMQRLSDLDFLAEYFRIFFLTSIRNYNKAVELIEKNNAVFCTLYRSMGELDAAIAILSFRKSLPFYSLPKFTVQNSLNMREVYHPLLKDPVPNTVALTKSSLVSGSNASGKSTMVKAIAINAILAQTMHTCTAEYFETRFTLVMTSMAVRDNLAEGESYFITEIKSLKRILQKIPEINCLCVIDEILKGTNTVERIAASAAVLKKLNQMDCRCIVATHDMELTQILKGQYQNYHFSEQITDDGIYFDYTIKPGASQTKNAIKLLDYMGFEREIIEESEELVAVFEKTQKWVYRE